MKKNMTNEQKDEYIKYLENKLEKITNSKEKKDLMDSDILPLLKAQEDFLVNHYADKDNLIEDNKRLNQEIARLVRTIMADNDYINYLLNSYWWKMSFPFRVISRKFRKRVGKSDYQFVEKLSTKKNFKSIKEKVSVIIFTYNAGEEFTVQLKNLKGQKLIDKLEIIVIDKGSTDNTISLAKRLNAKVISIKDNNLTDDQIYEKCLPNIHGEYVVIIDQNKIIDSKYWIYQAIRPIVDNQAVSTLIFRQDVNFIKNTTYYQELKERMSSISNEQVLFFPANRDIIQYFSPELLDKTCVLVKKKVSNMFLI